jgi:hypothetical protein
MSLREILLDRYAPQGVEVVQWLNGKASRDEVLRYLQTTVEQLEEIKQFLVTSITDFDKKTNQIFAAMRLQSHQIDTIIRLASDGSANGRQKFYTELRKTMAFAEFMDSLISKRGAYYEKTIKEKIEMLRGWNKQDDVIRCDFDALQLQKYMTENPGEFTEDEIVLLEQEFNFRMDRPTENIVIGDEVSVETTTES